MTNKEAIDIFQEYIKTISSYEDNDDMLDALDHAIKALGVCDRIKAIIDGWAVDDDEYELLDQIADIIREDVENE